VDCRCENCNPAGHDFVAVATPPMHGVNARDIEACQCSRADQISERYFLSFRSQLTVDSSQT
jgi:hypothetical protein